MPRQPGELRPTDVIGAFFVAGLAFLAAAAALGILQSVSPWAWGRWLALHLAFVGGVSQLILGASQFFVGAALATDPPPRRLVRAQLVTWNLGTVLLAVAVPERSKAPLICAAVLLAAALVLWAQGLRTMRARSLRVVPWATRWYATGAVFFSVGIAAGALLAWPVVWSGGDLLAAHMVLNLAGWFGAAIVGTLQTFFPSLTQTQLRFPRLQPWNFAAWTLGVAALAAGYAWSLDALALAGWFSLAIAGAILLANVLGCLRASPVRPAFPAAIVGTAQVFLLAGLALAVIEGLGGSAEPLSGGARAALGTLLVAGWVGLTVLGSLIHLLAVLIRVRNLAEPMPLPPARYGGPTAGLLAVGVAGVACGQLLDFESLRGVASGVLIAGYVILGVLVGRLAGGVLTKTKLAL